MTRKRVVYPLFFVLLSLMILIPSVNRAYAGNFKSSTKTDCTNTVGNCSSVGIAVSVGDFIMIHTICYTTSGEIVTPSDTIGNTFTMKTQLAPNGKDDIWTSISATGASDVVSVGAGSCTSPTPSLSYSFTVELFTGITGLGQTATNTISNAQNCAGGCSNSLQITAQSTSILYETLGLNEGSNMNNCPSSITSGSSANVVQTGCSQSISFSEAYGTAWIALGSQNPTMIWQFVTSQQFTTSTHMIIELLTVSQTLTALTNCYGNCGSPAITLVNTNSTHTINFNTSLTLFYEAQSNLNGVLNNVTANVAKTYTNGQQISLGLYTAVCNVGVLPFTASCPGQQQMVQTFTNPVKGRLVATQNGIQIQNTMWIAISVSCLIGGCDLNDTNTQVQLFNQAPSMPPVLASASSLGNSKLGLWAFITGTPNGVPPVIPTVSCGSDFLCIMAQSAISLTPSNPFAGAIFLAFIYSIFTTIAIIFISGYLAKSFGQLVTLPSGMFLMIWFGWFMFWPAIVGAIWFTVLVMIILILTFASFSGSLLKGGVGVGGQTA